MYIFYKHVIFFCNFTKNRPLFLNKSMWHQPKLRLCTTFVFLVILSAFSITRVRAIVLSDSAFYQQYPYIFILDNNEAPRQLTDEEFFDHAACVVFPVNCTGLPADNELLRELDSRIIPQLNADSLRLLRIVFRGAASPEGPVLNNNRLGRLRVQSLYDFVTSRLAFPVTDSLLSIETDIEDYRSLCLMMRRAGDPDYQLVQQLCDHWTDQGLPLLKSKLQAVRNGQLWQRLLRTYFPQLRTARFVMYFQKVPPTVPVEQISAIESTPIEPVVPVEPNASTQPVIPTPSAEPVVVPRRELLSVKTNLLFYGAYIPGYDRWCPIPNIAIEYYPLRGHFTYGASFDCPWWGDYQAHKYFQVRNYQLETRYYFRVNGAYGANKAHRANKAHGANKTHRANKPNGTPAFCGFYLQAYAHAGLFGICFDENRGWEGEGFGAGLGAGYVLPLSRNGHWRLEFQLQAGFFRCQYDPYQYENPVNPAYRDHQYYYQWTHKPEDFKKRQYRWNWIGPTRIGITLSYDLLYRRIQKKGCSFYSTETIVPEKAPVLTPQAIAE